MKKVLPLLLALILAALSAACAKAPAPAPGADETETAAAAGLTAAATEDDNSYPDDDAGLPSAEAVTRPTWEPSARSEFSHDITDRTLTLSWASLDKTVNDDIYAACARASAEKDVRFSQPGLPATDKLRDCGVYHDAFLEGCFTDGATGKAAAFMSVDYYADEEQMGMRADYTYVLRTADYGATWEISSTDFPMFVENEIPVFSPEGFYLFSYSETLAQQFCLCLNDRTNACRIRFRDAPYLQNGYYISGAVLDEAAGRFTLTAETTYQGWIGAKPAVPFYPEHYEIVTDMNLDQISLNRIGS